MDIRYRYVVLYASDPEAAWYTQSTRTEAEALRIMDEKKEEYSHGSIFILDMNIVSMDPVNFANAMIINYSQYTPTDAE